jgi:hypothetical protein
MKLLAYCDAKDKRSCRKVEKSNIAEIFIARAFLYVSFAILV